MKIRRDIYLDKLVRKKKNGMIKVVTGLRGCGKSYLLFRLFHDHLSESGIPDDHIIEIALDEPGNNWFRNPFVILQFIKERITDMDDFYILIDEVQYLKEFEGVLNSLLHIRNADVYVSGSTSKYLSTDVITEFRGRGDEIHVYPLSFSEYMSMYEDEKDDLLNDYLFYGGLPLVAMNKKPEEKAKFLTTLFHENYISHIAERYNIRNKAELEDLVKVLASEAGSYTNVSLTEKFRSVKKKAVGEKKIKKYTDCLTDSFLISRTERYDVKRENYIANLSKYYFEDTGLMYAGSGFSQDAETHLMENCIYNELRVRGCDVDTGMVLCYEPRANGKLSEKRMDVDFVVNKACKKYYIQPVFSSFDTRKIEQANKIFMSIKDNFPKFIVVRDNINLRCSNKGIITIGLNDFLLDKDSLRQ